MHAVITTTAVTELLDTWGFSLLLIPTGSLICAGVAFLAREEDDTKQVYLGLGLVALGITATNLLSIQTAAAFFGLRTASQLRAFRLPQWSELLTLHNWVIDRQLRSRSVGKESLNGKPMPAVALP